ncbi:MAG: 2-oxo acid dehydrogenase subunit E2 [Firmicutes bacterium]|nr:2-oxo acid dehydrogenase subunit E2 [Bacillota bacterium]
MAIPVIMPKQGQTVESCIIAKWHKKKGDQVKAGDILFTYETDKATFDEEAKEDGILLEIFFEEGDDVPVLTNVCVIGREGDDVSEFDPRTQIGREDKVTKTTVADKVGVEGEGEAYAANVAANVAADAAIEAAADTAADAAKQQGIGTGGETGFIRSDTGDGKIGISPRARNLAEKAGIDYRYAKPTGPHGRIIERDIISLMEKGPVFTFAAKDESLKSETKIVEEGSGIGGRITTGDLGRVQSESQVAAHASYSPGVVPGEAEFTEVKLTNIRKVIAKAMHHSLSSTAQLTLNTTFDATEILEYRKKLKENKEKLGLRNITINDIVLFAVSRTLPGHKPLNAHFLDDRMLLFNVVHLGVAVDTERGLMVPTIFYANHKSLNEISAEVKELAEECQKGTINPDLLKGGTFTVTNLGMLDIESFTPVLNPPQTGILGVNNIVQRVKEVNGQYVYYPAMGLSLTFDHRAVDGAPAARFLKDLKTNLENFSILLAK